MRRAPAHLHASPSSVLRPPSSVLGPPSSVLRPMRLLVVEDDAKIASFLVRGLKESGYAVDHAADGETGLLLAETTEYDAAVIDIMLPQLDGLSLVKRLRAKRQQTPVL